MDPVETSSIKDVLLGLKSFQDLENNWDFALQKNEVNDWVISQAQRSSYRQEINLDGSLIDKSSGAAKHDTSSAVKAKSDVLQISSITVGRVDKPTRIKPVGDSFIRSWPDAGGCSQARPCVQGLPPGWPR